MIELPPVLLRADIGELVSGHEAAVTGRVAALADFPSLSSLPVIEAPEDTPEHTNLLIVVGGGSRIDAAKAWRGRHRPSCMLLAIATRYGSGAEANGIAVLDTNGSKTIQMGPEFRPDARAYFPKTLNTLSDAELMWCAGDALTHAVEGLLSPLATEGLRIDLAKLVTEMLRLGPSCDPAWFELSAAASAGQSKSSVGLVHGLAHTLEAPARAELCDGKQRIGHARLCAGLLAPVLRYNFSRSDKAAERLSGVGIDQAALMTAADALSGAALDVPLDWAQLIETHWQFVLRDPCTRTNVATVRPSTLPDLLNELRSQ